MRYVCRWLPRIHLLFALPRILGSTVHCLQRSTVLRCTRTPERRLLRFLPLRYALPFPLYASLQHTTRFQRFFVVTCILPRSYLYRLTPLGSYTGLRFTAALFGLRTFLHAVARCGSPPTVRFTHYYRFLRFIYAAGTTRYTHTLHARDLPPVAVLVPVSRLHLVRVLVRLFGLTFTLRPPWFTLHTRFTFVTVTFFFCYRCTHVYVCCDVRCVSRTVCTFYVTVVALRVTFGCSRWVGSYHRFTCQPHSLPRILALRLHLRLPFPGARYAHNCPLPSIPLNPTFGFTWLHDAPFYVWFHYDARSHCPCGYSPPLPLHVVITGCPIATYLTVYVEHSSYTPHTLRTTLFMPCLVLANYPPTTTLPIYRITFPYTDNTPTHLPFYRFVCLHTRCAVDLPCLAPHVLVERPVWFTHVGLPDCCGSRCYFTFQLLLFAGYGVRRSRIVCCAFMTS